MLKNITYLIGAGASHGVLPLVKDLPADLRTFIESNGVTGPEQSKFKKDFLWLAKEAAKQASIDTLARQYSISGQNENLRKLKNIVTVFFYFKQACSYPNKRYDLFFSTVLDDNLTMPENIKFISWNYDLQFEIAFNNYTLCKNLEENQKRLCIINKGDIDTADSNTFQIYKINGTAQFKTNNAVYDLDYYSDRDTINPLMFYRKLCKLYNEIELEKGIESSLSFAWETAEFGDSFWKVIESTEILIVIGYSFPYFNRKVDTDLFKRMKKIQRVYIQDNPEHYATIKRKFKEITSSYFKVAIKDTPTIEEFFIPHAWLIQVLRIIILFKVGKVILCLVIACLCWGLISLLSE